MLDVDEQRIANAPVSLETCASVRHRLPTSVPAWGTLGCVHYCKASVAIFDFKTHSLHGGSSYNTSLRVINGVTSIGIPLVKTPRLYTILKTSFRPW